MQKPTGRRAAEASAVLPLGHSAKFDLFRSTWSRCAGRFMVTRLPRHVDATSSPSDAGWATCHFGQRLTEDELARSAVFKPYIRRSAMRRRGHDPSHFVSPHAFRIVDARHVQERPTTHCRECRARSRAGSRPPRPPPALPRRCRAALSGPSKRDVFETVFVRPRLVWGGWADTTIPPGPWSRRVRSVRFL